MARHRQAQVSATNPGRHRAAGREQHPLRNRGKWSVVAATGLALTAAFTLDVPHDSAPIDQGVAAGPHLAGRHLLVGTAVIAKTAPTPAKTTLLFNERLTTL